MEDSNLTRRALLKKVSGTAIAAAAIGAALPRFEDWSGAFTKQSPTGSPSAATAPYRAAVVVYLFGGNDSNNLIVPLDKDEYQAYASIRRHLAVPEHRLQTISDRAGRQYGLHPSVRELHRLYESGRLAIIANVGRPSQRPTHFDQDLHYLPDGYVIPSWVARWIGIDRTSDDGRIVTGFRAAHRPGHASALSMVSVTGETGVGTPVVGAGASRLRTTFPVSGLGQQLGAVAGLIESAQRAAPARQIFFCAMGGFDTHARQLERHADLLRDLSLSLGAFYDATEELGIAEQVVALTDTEFNRVLQPEDTGTGHGWGGHQIIVGGAVRGRDVYGDFPKMVVGGPGDADRAGVWRPSISCDQYAATVARWVGMPETALPSIFPRLPVAGLTTLGFLA